MAARGYFDTSCTLNGYNQKHRQPSGIRKNEIFFRSDQRVARRLIDEAALYEALSQGKLFGAGLDAFEEGEPPSKNNPLLQLGNVVATPHAGTGTAETQIKSSLMTAHQ